MSHPLDAALNHAATPTPLTDERQMIILAEIMRYTALAIGVSKDDMRTRQLADVIRLCRHWWERPRCEWGEHRPAEFAALVRDAYDDTLEECEYADELADTFTFVASYRPRSRFYEKPDPQFDALLVRLAATAATWLATILQQEAR